MFEQAQANTSIGTAYIYDEDGSLLGEYDNGSAKAAGRPEYIWLPTEAGQPIPVCILRNGNFFAIHSDHLGTPRLMTNEDNKPVWQWPYSAFGANKPTGILQATPNPRVAITNQPVLLKATAATELNLRFPGQYFDSETNLHYNYFRTYQPNQGRYTQSDPIGLEGGLNRFGYVEGNALSYTDPLGLTVELCERPVDIDWIPDLAARSMPKHNWLKTDAIESGMGAACDVPGQGCSDRPLAKTYTKDHGQQSQAPNASCKPVPDVDEQCVNAALKPGQYTGRWLPWNQCQSFTREVLDRCNAKNKPFIGYPHLTPRR